MLFYFIFPDVKGSDGFYPMTLYQAGTVYLLNVSTFYQNDLIATFSGDRFVDLFGMELQVRKYILMEIFLI